MIPVIVLRRAPRYGEVLKNEMKLVSEGRKVIVGIVRKSLDCSGSVSTCVDAVTS